MFQKIISRNLILMFALTTIAACGGGSSTSDTKVPLQKNVLFVGDPMNQTYAALQTLAPLAGSSLTSNLLDISALHSEPLQDVLGMAYDAQRDRLYTANGTQISILEHASFLKGRVVATSTITPLFPSKVDFRGLAQLSYDKQRDALYAAYRDNNVYNLAIFNDVSTLKGRVAPNKIVVMGTHSAGFFALDLKRSILYFIRDFSSDGGGNLLALIDFDKAGPITRSLRINGNGLRDGFQFFLGGVAVDPENDRLYMGLMGMGLVMINNVSSSTSTAQPVRDTAPDVNLITPVVVPMTMSNSLDLGLALDLANDRLYAGFGENVYIINQASKVTAATNVNLVLIHAPNTSISTFAFP